jgi:hypothetical protein
VRAGRGIITIVLLGVAGGACAHGADDVTPFCEAARPFAARSSRQQGDPPSDEAFHALVDHAPPELTPQMNRLHDLVHLERRSPAETEELQRLLQSTGVEIERRCGIHLAGVANGSS